MIYSIFSFLIFFQGIQDCLSYCPSYYSYGINEYNQCQTSFINDALGTDTININWDHNLFNSNNNLNNDTIWIKLVTNSYSNTPYNCNYSYHSIMFDSTNNHVLSKQIENTGSYSWIIPNYNFNYIDYYFILQSYEVAICDMNTNLIVNNYIISNSFSLRPKLNIGFTWFWPPKGIDDFTIQLGSRYNIIAQGYDHVDRIGYSLKLYASINNFSQSELWGTWKQVDMFDIDHSQVNIFEVPNWLNWGNYLDGFSQNMIDNTNVSNLINVSWIVPENAMAYTKSNGNIFSLVRSDGRTPIYLTDSDVKLRIITNIFTYQRDENGDINGYNTGCFDHNYNTICDSYESTAYKTDDFKIVTRINEIRTELDFITSSPSQSPSQNPSRSPSQNPSRSPSQNPSQSPSQNPSKHPTNNPSISPTLIPSNTPSNSPTQPPSNSPTQPPSNAPTQPPSNSPTQPPSYTPSLSPSIMPTNKPINIPTVTPSIIPSIENISSSNDLHETEIHLLMMKII